MFSTIIGALAGLAKLVSYWLGFKRDESLKQAGRDEVRVEQGQQGLDAHRRMSEAAAKPHDDAATQNNLDRGKF